MPTPETGDTLEVRDRLEVERAERDDLRAGREHLIEALREAYESLRSQIEVVYEFAPALSPGQVRVVNERLAPIRGRVGWEPYPNTPCPMEGRVQSRRPSFEELLNRAYDDSASFKALRVEVDELSEVYREASSFQGDLHNLSDWMREVAPDGAPYLGRPVDEATRQDVVRAWHEAAKVLGIEVIAPYTLEVEDGPISALALLVGIGRPKGTLLFDLNAFFECAPRVVDPGFWPIGIHPRSYRTFDRPVFEELVDDAKEANPDPKALLVRVSEPLCGMAVPEKQYQTELHCDEQDTDCAAWRLLLELIDEAAADGRQKFAPAHAMPRSFWQQIVTLPPSIAELTAVEDLHLYGSNLIAIPPQIGAMTSLKRFTPYTSRRLHWFPYEITRCPNLRDSTVSTRHLYGNLKHRMPFPALPTGVPRGSTPEGCSVCQEPLPTQGVIQVWISLRIATDVLPLLVHACSEECVRSLPRPPENYVDRAHQGGASLVQPDSGRF